MAASQNKPVPNLLHIDLLVWINKGGATKTTSAMMLARALNQRGVPFVLIFTEGAAAMHATGARTVKPLERLVLPWATGGYGVWWPHQQAPLPAHLIKPCFVRILDGRPTEDGLAGVTAGRVVVPIPNEEARLAFRRSVGSLAAMKPQPTVSLLPVLIQSGSPLPALILADAEQTGSTALDVVPFDEQVWGHPVPLTVLASPGAPRERGYGALDSALRAVVGAEAWALALDHGGVAKHRRAMTAFRTHAPTYHALLRRVADGVGIDSYFKAGFGVRG